MRVIFGNKKATKQSGIGRIVCLAIIVVGLGLIGFASYRLIDAHIEYAAARAEYEALRDIFSGFADSRSFLGNNFTGTDRQSQQSDVEEPSAPLSEETPLEGAYLGNAEFADPMIELSEINPDFVAWITIDSLIDYPLVQGRNNNRYLSVTFRGERNSSGAIFLDYRNSADFTDQVSIIYGHNMRDGSMFRPLHQLRDPDFLAEHQYITVIMQNWEILVYRIFAARIVNAWDTENNPKVMTAAAISRAIIDAPANAERVLILSTCTNNSDERLRIYAALVD
ncbi:MAG: class B sortase [Oscillospiraceae bacterium]|nr:class B sortase [Oscillospiraceae bacterium]